MKFTKRTQEKIQDILKTQGYVVRYERGNFKGGYCIVHAQKTIIINKFHPLEGKVSTLIDIVKDINIDEHLLSEDQQKMVSQILATTT
ncbi:MAG: hypothetical protein KDE26_07470 [Bacteroidetes bacterium]|nr:hypothetical protein [Bacteroidota bacterium]